uniref:Deuterosome assembly protein 1 n=1 Tax=Anolis carolinensis TaxID=28377 RepID=A0A803TUX4_ANOCA
MEKKTEALQEERVARSIPCDAELQELMQQIDIMVNNKKLEWEKRLQSLEAKMTVRDQELASAQSKLEQKGQEVWYNIWVQCLTLDICMTSDVSDMLFPFSIYKRQSMYKRWLIGLYRKGSYIA